MKIYFQTKKFVFQAPTKYLKKLDFEKKMKTKNKIQCLKKMILANYILTNKKDLKVLNNKSFKSKITKFDGKIIECDSFPSPIGTVCKIYCNDGTDL